MAFINAYLLGRFSKEIEGGPTWATRRVALRSGHVRRNANRSRPLYVFTLPYEGLPQDQHQLVISAFNRCRAGVDSFLIRDPSDYIAVDEALPVLGTGSEQQIQLVKSYTFGGGSVTRAIRKPESGSVTMKHNGSAQSATIDYTTGIATLTAPSGHVLTWSGKFGVPVFFSNDRFLSRVVGRNGRGLVMVADADLEEDLSV